MAKTFALQIIEETPDMGKEMKDVVTGFTGVATGFAQHMTGCDQYYLQPKIGRDKKFSDGRWFDVNSLMVTSEKQLKLDTEVDKGACCPMPEK